MSRPSVSVVICTRNPREAYFRRVLAALETQTLPQTEWELIIVDNGSSPSIENRAFALPTNGRVVIEAQIGLTAARLKGIGEATGELIVFVDDDNELASDYLARAIELASEFPKIGALGGQLIPEFEMMPEPWVMQFAKNLALVDLDRDRWTNQRDFSAFPPGAGMCVRRQVAQSYATHVSADALRRELDRAGDSLASGGDTDLVLQALDAGWGIGQFTRLQLTHLIPCERLTLEYHKRLAEGISRSAGMLSATRSAEKPDFLRHRIRGWLSILRARGPVRSIAAATARGWVSGLREGWKVKVEGAR